MIEVRELLQGVVVIGDDAHAVGLRASEVEADGRRVVGFVGAGDDPRLAEMLTELLETPGS